MIQRLTLLVTLANVCILGAPLSAGIVFDDTTSIVYAEINEFPNRSSVFDSSGAAVSAVGDYLVSALGPSATPSEAINDLSISIAGDGNDND